MTVSPASITGEFISVDPTTGKTGTADSFTLDLSKYQVSNGIAAAKVAAKPATKSKAAKARKK